MPSPVFTYRVSGISSTGVAHHHDGAVASVGSPPMSFTPYDRPVRAAFIGLGRIYDLNMRAYVDNPDVEVVALVDPSEERRAQRQADWPAARTFASAAELAASGLEVDAVEGLLPI